MRRDTASPARSAAEAVPCSSRIRRSGTGIGSMALLTPQVLRTVIPGIQLGIPVDPGRSGVLCCSGQSRRRGNRHGRGHPQRRIARERSPRRARAGRSLVRDARPRADAPDPAAAGCRPLGHRCRLVGSGLGRGHLSRPDRACGRRGPAARRRGGGPAAARCRPRDAAAGRPGSVLEADPVHHGHLVAVAAAAGRQPRPGDPALRRPALVLAYRPAGPGFGWCRPPRSASACWPPVSARPA